MTLTRIDRTEWFVFFEQFSKQCGGRRAEVEVVSRRLGDQIVAEWLPLLGIVYDSKADSLEVALAGIDHRVQRPREVYVDGTPYGFERLAVVDADGVLQIVTLREPLLLPPFSEAL
jgi:Family of unknown function (DUF5335)